MEISRALLEGEVRVGADADAISRATVYVRDAGERVPGIAIGELAVVVIFVGDLVGADAGILLGDDATAFTEVGADVVAAAADEPHQLHPPR